MGPQQHPRQSPTMRFIHEQQELPVPEGVKVNIKSRQVTVEGPRGKLHKDLSHLAVCFSTPTKNKILIEMHHGSRKAIAALRTVRTIINNMFIGVTKGFKYKMRYVYAHFPITGVINKGGAQLEIRNFLGEKRRRTVNLIGDTRVVKSGDVKDQIEISGNNIEDVGRSCALI